MERKRRFGKSLPHEPRGKESIRSLFSKFRQILEMNNRSLAVMADMERALGGEYIFDRNFLEQSVDQLGRLVHQSVYSINAMTHNRYVPLLDRFQKIQNTLVDMVEGGLGPLAHWATIGARDIGWDTEPLVGLEAAALAEVHLQTRWAVPDGFLLTATGVDRLLAFWNREGRPLLHHGIPGGANPLSFSETGNMASGPSELVKEVVSRLAALTRNANQETSVLVRAVPAGALGSGDPLASSEALKTTARGPIFEVVRKALIDLAHRQGTTDPEDRMEAAVWITQEVRGDIFGTVTTLDSGRSLPNLAKVEVFSGSSSLPIKLMDRFWLNRVEPYELMESEIQPKNTHGFVSSHGEQGDLRQGSGLAPLSLLKSVVEAALVIDRVVGRPLEVDWVWSEKGSLTILGFRSQDLVSDLEGLVESMVRETAAAEVLLRGGETAQLGVAAGRVIPVDESDDPMKFPLGAVALARRASPSFSPLLRRAAAFVSETGNAAGHLATVARECRVPAMVGAAGAMEALSIQEKVTVDAEECVVYRGVVESLLRYRAGGLDLTPTDPEYVLLRRLLRLITPLNLYDPESPGFAPEHCQTLHDLLHFVHERAVEELIEIQDRHPGIRSVKSRPLALKIPLDLWVLDIDNGLADQGEGTVAVDDVVCRPLRCLLQGLDLEEMWDRQPVPLRLRDIISGLDRTQALLQGRPSFSGRNLAMITRNYLNLSLRLGYHFSVVDAHFEESRRNAVYFRFAGGLADPVRRARRAEFIRSVLNTLNFRVTVKGDLVIGKLKEADLHGAERALRRLGELTAFTRQLDVAMGSDQDVDGFLTLFLQRLQTRSLESGL